MSVTVFILSLVQLSVDVFNIVIITVVSTLCSCFVRKKTERCVIKAQALPATVLFWKKYSHPTHAPIRKLCGKLQKVLLVFKGFLDQLIYK